MTTGSEGADESPSVAHEDEAPEAPSSGPGTGPGPDPAPASSGVSAAEQVTATKGLIGPFTAKHIIVLVGLIAVSAVLLVALSSRSGTNTASGGPAPTPGTSFYLIGDAGTGLEIGNRPPPFASAEEAPILDLNGEVVEIAALEGRPVWVIFWATWCPPCQQETPDVQRAWEAYGDTDLKIIAVDVQESDGIARDYAEKYGLTYDMAIDREGSAFRNWTVFGLPTHYFIGRDGLIADKYFGPMTLEQMEERLDAITPPGPSAAVTDVLLQQDPPRSHISGT